MMEAIPSCFWLLTHLILMPLVFAFANVGKSMPARIAMIAITTRSSINVNPRIDGNCLRSI
jgi:hypothetical protein